MQSASNILTSSNKFHINLGLSRTLEALNKLGNPHKDVQFIHVAGTNGKGSTCAILNEILCTHFKNTNVNIGLFTSPHLFSYCERIKVNNKNISQQDLDKYVNLAASSNSELTEFEILTVAMFLYFRDKNVKYAVLEVGLGGRFDSTNVIENPLCSIITTVDFDHTQRLGTKISDIAYQKAGIIKKNCPVVIGIDNPAYQTVSECARSVGSPLFSPSFGVDISFDLNKNYATIHGERLEFSLLGKFQAKNLKLAIECLRHLPFSVSIDEIKTALKNVKWPFRLEYHPEKNLLIDGAHNPSGVYELRKFLDEYFPNVKKAFVFGCLNNKDYSKMLSKLVTDEDELYFYEFNYPNTLKFELLPPDIKQKAVKIENPFEIIDNKDKFKIVCGSLYMLGELFNSR